MTWYDNISIHNLKHRTTLSQHWKSAAMLCLEGLILVHFHVSLIQAEPAKVHFYPENWMELVSLKVNYNNYMAVCQNLVPLVNIKIAGKWMFIPLNMVLIGIDPYPYTVNKFKGKFRDSIRIWHCSFLPAEKNTRVGWKKCGRPYGNMM